MDWMRCNSCWIKVENNQAQFYLIQCGHVYCNKCVTEAKQKCFQCGTMGTSSLPLKEPLNPQISHYFTRPADLLDKVTQAQRFQESQLSLCLQRSDLYDNKYQTLKEAYRIGSENLKKLYQKYNKLKITMALIKKKNVSPNIITHASSQYQTPPNQVNNLRPQEKYSHGYYGKKNIDNSMRNNEEFRVPTSTRVPRSAGYYTASSCDSYSSNYTNTPNFNFNNY